MRRAGRPIQALAATLILGACAAPTDESRTASRSAGIVGGGPDLVHTAVFDILVEGEQACTGTLVSPHVVLTAAHCIVEDVDDATELVVFTGPDEANLAGGTLHAVVAGPVHPTYGTNPVDEDIGDLAVLVLAEPSAITPMRYNRKPPVQAMVGQPVTMIGYGDTTVVEPTSGGGRRKQATSPLLGFDTNWVRVGDLAANQCYGDSGGPVVAVIDGVEQVIGVDSWQVNDDCNSVNYNTRIDPLVAWIDGHVQANDPGFDVDGPGGDTGGGGDPGGGGGDPGGGGGDPGGGGDDVEEGDDGDGEDAGDDRVVGTDPACQVTVARRGGPALPLLALALLGVLRALPSRAWRGRSSS